MASPAHPRHPRAHFPRAGVEGSRELFDLERNARRAAEIVARRFAPQRLMRRLARTYRDWDRLLDALPRSLTNALDRVDQGRFSVHLEHQRLDTVANRLVLGLLSSALLLGSTLRWALGAPPKIAGVSAFSPPARA